MNTRERSGQDQTPIRAEGRALRMAPVARAIALMLAAGGISGAAHAQRAFSPAWFGAMGATQNTVANTGMLPNGKPASSLTNPSAQQQQANAQLQHSINNLNLAAQAIALQQATQAAERQRAMNDPSVPDGLGEGGLKVDSNSLTAGWINAKALGKDSQQVVGGKTTVTIDQTADKAILNWETFNVGKNTTVQFNQQSDWAILNRVNDPAGRPSQIQGQIKADGTVLIVNRNGIVFSGSSQVDTHNLVAAAANISDDQFNTQGIYSRQQSGNYVPSFTDALGKVQIEAGAQIATRDPSSVTQGGGYVLLLGSAVANAGQITTPKGQAQLAAGDNFLIRKGVATDANQFSTTRGNEVAPQFNADSSAGAASNTGLILAREGDVTLTGRDVRQDGVTVATTTVNNRGTIHLLNSAADTLGQVTLGNGATTAVVIEDDGTTTALDSQRDALIQDSAVQDRARTAANLAGFDNLSRMNDRRDESRIEIVSGNDVNFEGNSLTLATGGQIAVSAAHRSVVADNAQLDVSGAVGVNVAMSANNIEINVQGNEQRDAPINRDTAILNNSNIWIDRRSLIHVAAGVGGDPSDRWYTAGGLLEVGGYLGLTDHSIGEWAAAGGSVAFSGAEVVTQGGSNINLSGGTLDVQTGTMHQTWLLGADGHVYDASNAPGDVVYKGLYVGYMDEHPRWGDTATENFGSPLIAPQKVLENGYTVGRDAGQLIVSTSAAVLEGDVTAETYQAPRQTQKADPELDSYDQSQNAAARGAQLVLGHYDTAANTNPKNGAVGVFHNLTPSFDNIVFTDNYTSVADLLQDTLYLDSAKLDSFGLGAIIVAATDSVTVNGALTVVPGGTIELHGPQVAVNANLTAPGGDIVLGNVLESVATTGVTVEIPLPAGRDAPTGVTIGQDATLDARGLWSNLELDPDGVGGLPYIDGGSVSVRSTGAVTLAAGTLIDVSSGASLMADGSFQGGKGGDVTLAASNVFDEAHPPIAGAPLQLDGALRAYGVQGGGTLTIESGTAVDIGASNTQDVSDAPVLVLDTSLFQTGFSNYVVTGHDGLSVTDGTVLDVSMPVYRWEGAGASLAGGADPSQALRLWTPPVYQEDPVHGVLTQRGGASLSLNAGSYFDSDMPLEVGQGAVVTVDPGQAIALHSSESQLTIDGRLNAWGGSITVDNLPENGSLLRVSTTRSIWIGESAVLDAAARAYVADDNQGRAYGVAPDGGSITLGPSDSFIVIRPGAVLDASGSAANIDLAAGSNAPSRPVALAGDGGSIALHTDNGIYIDGDLRAFAGGAGAAGGSLLVDMASRVYDAKVEPILEAIQRTHDITLVQDRRASGLADDLAPGQEDDGLHFGEAVLSAQQVQDGGFDALTLSARDRFIFEGDLDLSLGRSLNLQHGAWTVSDATPNAQVTLAAPYIRLDGGAWIGVPGAYTPGFVNGGSQSTQVSGTSALTLSADVIDIYGMVLSGMFAQQGDGPIVAPDSNGSGPQAPVNMQDLPGFATLALDATGDVRLGTGDATTGTNLISSGDIFIDAAQLYPMSGAKAAIEAGLRRFPAAFGGKEVDSGSRLTIRSNGNEAPVPASVFGQLMLTGGTVDQGGVVRAPLGTLVLNDRANDNATVFPYTDGSSVVLRSGSVTSVSADGLVMPFGGTSDGLTYRGSAGTLINLGEGVLGTNSLTPGALASGITIGGNSLVAESGSVLDLSGGGDLRGEGFVSGRGGSVDVLTTPLANANPALNKSSGAGNQVYAIMPGYASAYAPVIADKGAGDPAIGRQIDVGAGVPGLQAGTYTLLPASYALMPGAFRVEIGATFTTPTSSVPVPGGSFATSAILETAGTSIRGALPNRLLVTPGSVVRHLSQYNETTYADFAIGQAAQFGNVRPRLPEDGKVLHLDFVQDDDAVPLQFDGIAKLAGTGDGITGQVVVNGNAPIEITAAGAAPVAGSISLAADDLNAFNAGTLSIGGYYSYFNGLSNSGDSPRLYFIGGPDVHVRDGATIKAGQIFLIGQNVTVDGGATLDTRGFGDPGIDSSMGYVFANNLNAVDGGPAVLAVGNGRLDFLGAAGTGTIAVADGATLLTEGTIAFVAPGALSLGKVDMGARYLTVSQNQIDIGTADSLAVAQAAGALPAGWQLTQEVLDGLLHPSSESGVPALERLSLTAGGAFNFFGTVTLDTGGSDAQLVLNTPAFYGWGTDTDVVRLATGTLVWNGVATGSGTDSNPFVSVTPTAVVPGGPGTGTGHLVIDADTVMFGYDAQSQAQTQATLDRVALGFGAVDINASDRITANSKGTLSVGSARDGSGTLTMTTPLLTGEAGAEMSYVAGGALRVSAPASAAPADTTSIGDLGASLTLQGQSVVLDTATALPSGKLTISANGDITLGDNARIDLAGRGVTFFDVTEYSWGGALAMGSSHGDITQAAASVVDVSAQNNDAGSITAAAADAAHGHISLAGTLRASATEGYQDGQVGLRAQDMGDFAALNAKLNDAGFFGARSFDLLRGDLTVGNEVKARNVSISVDAGSLTVNGTIDASGEQVGSISLGASGNLVLASTSTLDTHGTQLQTDSNGAPIDASNTAHVDLTTTQGTVTLADGAIIDMRSADDVARGKLTLNAPRLGGADGAGDGANDIAVNAAGHLDIRGAQSIAVNGFRTYDLPGGSEVDQAYFNTVDDANESFINAAWNNTGLQGRLAGLTAYGAAYHLRPGVEIDAAGDLTVTGDLDLSGYRYGPDADPNVRGSGEPGVLVLRAAGNLTINGSITDGFAPPPGTPDDAGWIVMNAGQLAADLTLGQDIVLGMGSTFPVGSVLGYGIPILGSEQLAAGTPASKAFTLSSNVTLPAGYVFTAAIGIAPVAAPGSTLSDDLPALWNDIVVQADWFLAPGSPEGNYADSVGGLDVYDSNGILMQPFPTSGATIPKGSILPAGDSFMGFPAGFVVPANVFPKGIELGQPVGYDAGTKLSASLFVPAGTTIPVGFTLPQTVTTQTGAIVRANTVLPTQITLGADIAVSAAFVATAAITTPTHTFKPGDTVAAGTTLPFGTLIGAGNDLPFAAPVTSMTWSAGAPLDFVDPVTTAADVHLTAGSVVPQGTDMLGANGNTQSITRSGQNWAAAPLLAPGSQSWSMTLVAGADLGAVDTHSLQTRAALGASGNVVLSDPHFMNPQLTLMMPSVIRTGTGDLQIIAGGNYSQQSPFGVYTAGTAIDPSQSAPYNLTHTLGADDTDPTTYAAYESTLSVQRMWFTEHGGDVTLTAQGDISGYQDANSQSIGDWLWRQGGDGLGQKTAWGVNFGSYVLDGTAAFDHAIGFAAFSGIGALGGGNVSLNAGRNIGGSIDALPTGVGNTGIVAAVGGSGRVVDGQVVQTGGGNLSVTADGSVYGGLLVDLRGDTTVNAGSVGRVMPTKYGSRNGDPRPLDPDIAYAGLSTGAVRFAPGDGAISVNTLGDLVLGALIDPGRVTLRSETLANATTDAGSQAGSGATWFTLFTNDTTVDAFSAGGNASALNDTVTAMIPSVLRIAAAGGSIYFAPNEGNSFMMPSPTGQLELLARDLISSDGANSANNASGTFGPLGTSLSSLATPLNPAWRLGSNTGMFNGNSDRLILASNYWGADPNQPIDFLPIVGSPFMFGPDMLTDDSAAGDGTPSRIYAVNGDVLGIRYGRAQLLGQGFGETLQTYYQSSKPLRILAGGDILDTTAVIVQDSPNDVSMIAATGSVIDTNVSMIGPGTLEVTAGKQFYQANQASLVSLGAIEVGDLRPGADIVVQAGVGAGLPGQGASDFADFAKRYLDPANLADASRPLADQPGKVVKTYDAELIEWLGERYGFTGTAASALAYFDGLAPEQQRIFVRQVYYAELTAGGREFNDPDSQRFGSYLRGRDAIAALFPMQDADGHAIDRDGDITLYQGVNSNAGIRTVAGGSIQTLTPGGATVVGVEGILPSTSSTATPAGLLTQGAGDIQMYSEGSILLGLSRIMTTFGGDILGWSATGDINAGRGAKTTVVYTPPKRVYDDYGNVVLSPQVPSSGAGIATLNPIPEIPPGDVDLIAPLGTIDAGEAGIRVSGNVNLAALQVVNAANIQVQGKSTGIPIVAAVNVGALTTASAAAAQATIAAQDVVQRERVAARQALPSVFTVRVIGFGNEPAKDDGTTSMPSSDRQPRAQIHYDPANPVQLVGNGRNFNAQQLARLTSDERRRLLQDR